MVSASLTIKEEPVADEVKVEDVAPEASENISENQKLEVPPDQDINFSDETLSLASSSSKSSPRISTRTTAQPTKKRTRCDHCNKSFVSLKKHLHHCKEKENGGHQASFVSSTPKPDAFANGKSLLKIKNIGQKRRASDSIVDETDAKARRLETNSEFGVIGDAFSLNQESFDNGGSPDSSLSASSNSKQNGNESEVFYHCPRCKMASKTMVEVVKHVMMEHGKSFSMLGGFFNVSTFASGIQPAEFREKGIKIKKSNMASSRTTTSAETSRES